MSDYGSVVDRGSVVPKTNNAPLPRQPSVVIIEEKEEEKIKPANVKKNPGIFELN